MTTCGSATDMCYNGGGTHIIAVNLNVCNIKLSHCSSEGMKKDWNLSDTLQWARSSSHTREAGGSGGELIQAPLHFSVHA